jgi:hypothetical protein
MMKKPIIIFLKLPCVAVLFDFLAIVVAPAAVMTRAALGQHTLLGHRVQHEAILALATRSADCRRRRHIHVHVLACQRFSGLACRKHLVIGGRALFGNVLGRRILDGVEAFRLNATPSAAIASAQLKVLLARSHLLVVGLELEAFVLALAHANCDALVVVVEHLTGGTATALDTLQSERVTKKNGGWSEEKFN